MSREDLPVSFDDSFFSGLKKFLTTYGSCLYKRALRRKDEFFLFRNFDWEMGGNSVVQLHISRSLAKIAHSSAGYGEKATTKNILYSQPLLLFCASPHCVRLS